MKNLLGFLKAKASFPPEHKVELFARGECFRFSRGAESFEGICFLDYYRDEWSRLTLMADSIRQIVPTNLAPLTHQQQDAIAAEAMHLLQLKNGNTKVSVARSDT